MVHRGFLLLCLIVASLVATSVVHAQEMPNLATLACSGVVHADGDMDQSPGDADRGVAHHHGCHASSVFIPAVSDDMGVISPSALRPLVMPSALPVRWIVGPDLRPPIA